MYELNGYDRLMIRREEDDWKYNFGGWRKHIQTLGYEGLRFMLIEFSCLIGKTGNMDYDRAIGRLMNDISDEMSFVRDWEEWFEDIERTQRELIIGQ